MIKVNVSFCDPKSHCSSAAMKIPMACYSNISRTGPIYQSTSQKDLEAVALRLTLCHSKGLLKSSIGLLRRTVEPSIRYVKINCTIDSDDTLNVAQKILGRNFTASLPNQKRARDIPYIWTREG